VDVDVDKRAYLEAVGRGGHGNGNGNGDGEDGLAVVDIVFCVVVPVAGFVFIACFALWWGRRRPAASTTAGSRSKFVI